MEGVDEEEQQQQLQQVRGVISVALGKSSSSSSSSESLRLGAIKSLHRLILYNPNTLLLSHSPSFLFHSLSQLLSNHFLSHPVRHSAATAYGALCAVLCSIPVTSNARHDLLVDRFINWALPLLKNVTSSDGSSELALESLREFLSVGDVGATELYSFPILQACQQLLEDDRISLHLLQPLLGVLTIISLKFFRCFQPHFVDIVDVLLGWAMVPDLADSNRSVIFSSFLQFQKYWVVNLQFPIGLLSKFLGDMDMLLKDDSPGTPQQFKRLLALFSCFSTVLQSTASGLLEMNLLEQIIEPLIKMIPQLLWCLSLLGRKFGWSIWIEDSWRCLTLLAEILGEKFCIFYPLALDVLTQSLDVNGSAKPMGDGILTSFHIHGVLKTNLQLLSLQKLGLLPSSVCKILQWDAPISQLRLHPNHLVTASSAATYVFLLQHGNDEVVEHSINCLFHELGLLNGIVLKDLGNEDVVNCPPSSDAYSKLELSAFIKFDVKVLLSCVCLGKEDSLFPQSDTASSLLKRSVKVASFLMTNLWPLYSSVQSFVELQVTILEALGRVTSVELLSRCSIELCSIEKTNDVCMNLSIVTPKFWGIAIDHLNKYISILLKALDINSPLAVKINALDWVCMYCDDMTRISERLGGNILHCEDSGYNSAVCTLVSSVFSAAFDREPKVRLEVATVFGSILRAKLVHPKHFYQMSEFILEKIGDPDANIKNAFVRRLSLFLPVAIYLFGSSDGGMVTTARFNFCKIGSRAGLHWRHVFALKQLPQRLQPQQLVSILSYISQRWKAPLFSWIQRLILHCNSVKDSNQSPVEEASSCDDNSLWMDVILEADVLERTSLVNNIAGVWWAIHEAARYCTTTRLRTNLGGPTQTFAALERMLLDVAHMLQLVTEHNDGGLSIMGSHGTRLLPMRLLLDFVEALKKNVYNAYEGSSVLPCASRQSSLFFRANKKVCEEWFSRICEPMMNAGLALQCHDAVVHYCSLRLQELRISVVSTSREKSRVQMTDNQHIKSAGDVMNIVRHMALALSKKHESAALIGLQKWVHLTFSSLLDESLKDAKDNPISGPFSWITGLVHQADGAYEKAAAFFTHLLQTEEFLSSMGADGIQFTIERVIESYAAVSDWRSLDSWLLELHNLRAKHAGKSYSGALTTTGNEINAIHALAHFDEGDIQAAWASLDLTPKSSSELTLDPKLALQRSEQMLLQALLCKAEGKLVLVQDELQKAKSMLDEILTVLPLDGFPEAVPFAIHLHCIDALEEECGFNKLLGKPPSSESFVNSLLQAAHQPMSVVQQDCNPWLKLFRVYRTILPASAATLELCKNLMGLARKQGNLGLANHFKNCLRDQINSGLEISNHQFLISSVTYEEILLMYAENKFMDAFAHMWSYVKSSFLSLQCVDSVVADNRLMAKACLKFSNWLKQDYTDFNVENVVVDVVTDFNQSRGGNESLTEECTTSKPSTLLVVEEITGIAAKLATRLCPTMGKSWISYASWCFSQAKESIFPSHDTVLHSCSLPPLLVSELLPKRFSLTEDEISRVRSIISQLLFAKDITEGKEMHPWVELADDLINFNHATTLVDKVVKVIETAAGAPGVENFACESLPAAVSSQLFRTLLDENVHTEEDITKSSLNDLVDIWWSLRRRRVSLFGHAAHGFIQYLSYSSSKVSGSPPTGHDSKSFSQKNSSLILRATLYILHILLNYGLELKDTLEPALSAVPLSPWQEVTPQLFARLGSHPEPKTRKQLEGLVMMLAKSTPWSVIYPTLVDVNASDDRPAEELQHILDCLMKLYPRLVQDVKLMIYELGNVTVLWEELWLSTLQDLHGDVMRRMNLLKEEAARISENITLSHSEKIKINASKYSAMMAPIVVALERRLSLISKKPETPHEKWFQNEYKEPIKLAISAFKNPPASASSLGDVWRPFDSIAASLASYQRKSAVTLEEVAPQLARLSSSDVPMPGLETQFMLSESERDFGSSSLGIVTIASFSEQVTILSTKTKPKKLVILGSDGGKYTYLLKGREDLRLDARIMQLLQAVNSFIHSHPETRSRSIGIRYYSVTPISGRAGLIQWVDNVVSVYSTFKSWQQRDQLAQLLAAGGGNVKNTVPQPVPRPSDMFYGKIIPALKEKGIKRVISRRDWPHEVKLKVLLDLMKQTPRQLLHQELWCASESFRAFSSKLKRYSGSLAAMSMVGHILGLGDRHLDNILIDFFTGDIVHIDYNVCFDKGHRLKVPEIVPFRLTQILEAALGLTGLEGVFRTNCEAVLGVLRRNKDILLMLLEVFVWDPLVEWTRGDFHDDAAIGGEERKGMELAVSLSLFASRVQEIRVPLQEHHDLLLSTAPAVESAFGRFLNILNRYELVSANYFRADQERSTLVLHETSAKSIVAEATSLSEKTRALYEVQAQEFAQAKATVAEKALEASTWLEQHGRFLDALRNDIIPEIKTGITLSGMEDALSLTSAVSVAGVPLTVVPEPTQAQCLEIDREISQLICELDHGVSSAVTYLRAYSVALQSFLPLNYLATSPVHSWAQILQSSINTLSLDMLSLAHRQAGELVANMHGGSVDYVRRNRDDLCLKSKKYALEMEKLEEEYAGLVNSIGSEAELKAKDRLLSAFWKYMQLSDFTRNDDPFPSLPPMQFKHESSRDAKGEHNVKREKTLLVLCGALCSLFDDVKDKITEIFSESATAAFVDSMQQLNFGTVYSALEEQIEKCVLAVDFFNQLQHSGSSGTGSSDTEVSKENWASIFKATLVSCADLILHMGEGVLPELVKSIVLIDSEVMDAFGALSNIRGSVESALEQLVEVEVEKDSLEELEKGYFFKVDLITEQQLALEEAAMQGRDHLSWEEAEELASQEEACRAQLDQLHLSWNQKDTQSSSLIKREADIKDGLLSLEQHLSLLGSEEERVVHGFRSKALLSTLGRPFSKLESLDKAILDCCGASFRQNNSLSQAKFLSSGCQMSEYIWKFKGLLDGREFFAWKVAVMDLILDLTIHDVSSCADLTFGMDQLVDAIKKKLVVQLQVVMSQYIKERIALTFFHCLTKETEHLKKQIEALRELGYHGGLKNDATTVKRVKVMLEEYCNAHETVRAARSAASLMKKQISELKEAIRKTTHEIIQMEWMHDSTLVPTQDSRVIAHKFLETDDMYHLVLDLSRPKFLERLRFAASKIASSLECLQSSERTSSTAEGQLERAMNWACGGPNSSMSSNSSCKVSGIPLQFHDRLKRRRQLLSEVQEKATDIMKVAMSILEFEISRDGTLCSLGEVFPISTGDGRAWQQSYLNALTRLEVTFHSYARAEQECNFAQSSLEAASSGLYSASNELSVASLKAKSASGDLQSTLLQMRDCASEVSVSLSAFSHVARGHTALTSECGSMLEEVLAISNGLHDVHNLGKEAAAMHRSLMDSISKASEIIFPLESVLSKDVTAMTDAMSKEREDKAGISPIHGQAIYQSYCTRTKEAFQAFKPLVPSLMSSAKELYSLLTKLAQTASLHAGNLHKVVGGIEGNLEASSQHVTLSRDDMSDSVSDFGDVGRGLLSDFDGEMDDTESGVSFSPTEDKGWISPPDSIYSSSTGVSIISGETSSSNSLSFQKDEMEDRDGADAIYSNSQPHDPSDGVCSVLSRDERREMLKEEELEVTLEVGDEATSSSRLGAVSETQAGQQLKNESARATTGKNAFAMSVLRRVEMKLDGLDISENRELSTMEQVDYLLKQATSVDNLCNMYEGWTPWI